MVDIIHWIISFGCFCSSFSNPRYLHYPPFPRLIHHQFLLLKNNDSNKAVISKLSNFQLKSRAIFGWLYIIDMKYFIQYSRMILSIIQISFRLTKKNYFQPISGVPNLENLIFGFRLQHQQTKNLIWGGVISEIFEIERCRTWPARLSKIQKISF